MNEDVKTILVVEDDKLLRGKMAAYLEDRGFRVVTAADGRQGVEAFQREQPEPDLVLTDLNMPEMDGLAVLQRIGELSPETPVIVVSGTGRIGDSIRALRFGAWDYILKPVEELSIVSLSVNKALERARLIRENREYQENLEQLVSRRTEQLEQATDTLRMSEMRFRDLAEMLPEAIFETDSQLNLLYVNRRSLQIFGYSEDDLAKGLNALDAVLPQDRGMARKNVAKRVQQKTFGGVEYQALRKDGSTFPALFNLNPIINGGGEVTGFRGVIFDLTEQKRAAEERERLHEQLNQSQKMEAIGTLAGGIAHDFNNILAGIMGCAELALRAAHDGKTLPEKLEQILKASERAKVLVNQILTFGRKSKTNFMPLDLNQEITGIVPIIRSTIPRMISVELNLDSEAKNVIGDANQIEQVLLNLCTNAQDAMPDGGNLVIETKGVFLDEEYASAHHGVSPGNYVLLTVSDTGQGMEKDTLEHIFEPFFTTKEVGKGTGLGLATAYGVVKSHGGSITCHSEPGSGTTFSVYLPALATKEASDKAGELETVAMPEGHETILLVDDEEVIRDVGREFLASSGYQTITAHDGESALDIYHEKGADIDLVILDISMPGMGGRKCLEEIISINPAAKVIVASGYSSSAPLAEDASDPLATGFIAKPFRMVDLLKTVRQTLDS